MIPLQLSLKNFLSYREATLDFRGLHTACVCGPNGSGKSSLLEAIAWSLWGQSRASSEDDIIHLGAKEAQVDFTFQSHQQIYRVIRTRSRGQASSLEFQVAIAGLNAGSVTPTFRPLTERGMRATQQLILDHLKLDYETFVNSAYLRQGRADEFMLKRPSERKQILADLLKLDQYDELAEQSKDLSRQAKGQIDLLERSLESIQEQLQQREAIAQEQAVLETDLVAMQATQTANQEQLQQLQAMQHQRRTWEQQLTWQQQQQRSLNQDYRRLQQDLASAQHQEQELAALLGQEEAIAAGYAQFQSLQVQEEEQSAKFQAHQSAQTQRQRLQQQQAQQIGEIKDQLRHLEAQLEALRQQEQDVQHTLNKAAEVETAMERLQQARARLTELDQLQTQVAPLLQRQHQLQSQIERAQDRLTARLEELRTTVRQLQAQQARQPKLQQAALEVAEQIEHLEKRQVYQQRVREKGLERRSFLERLQVHQRDYEAQLAELENKVQLLQQPNAACPLCDRPLDKHHWQLVQQKNEAEHQEIIDQLWVVREQLAVSDREIHVLRQEYRDLDRELAGHKGLLERRGQLQEQLQVSLEMQEKLQQVLAEQEKLQQALSTGYYATELQEELTALEQSLQQLNYDDRNHALAKGEAERWRWAEIKQAEIKQAQRRQANLAARQPELEAQIAAIQQQLEQQQTDSPLQQSINALDQAIAEIDYNLDHHNALRTQVRQAQAWQFRYQSLCQAQQQYPQVQQRIAELSELLEVRSQHLQQATTQLEQLIQQLEQMADPAEQIRSLEQQIQQQQAQLNGQLARLGRLQQQQQHLETLQVQAEAQQQQLQTARRQYRVYHELSQAFGKNGIQALMIENVLPQLEAETNQILARLSANQLHVQFVTQRAGRGKGTKASSRLIDTLDILIADIRGTRPYETYSGGEAFRVNFAIRLALAKLLAQRSGTALQMLIVDEGFGTQDSEGCDRLIAAINAIASDFSCILTVTHMPHFKEAFQARIEVHKTESGSQLHLSL
ncbi:MULTISPECIES: exonuclease subunit SbcC [Trichocoleus]|uniref:Nuclease SbcCD subunit C n=1 Tax=Trichocoleus desertorum GB2-A4 TaxID=2933944 RepID=A0ABV0J1V7_9CYAN|nr:exonuclease subunit SbcC [Trichocoleus sp. FACHB-46]MBD1860370.1 exonuclease subunit SbcC [Trichocoleus sp. FACHB-46]